jgi:hypothetical protein
MFQRDWGMAPFSVSSARNSSSGGAQKDNATAGIRKRIKKIKASCRLFLSLQ